MLDGASLGKTESARDLLHPPDSRTVVHSLPQRSGAEAKQAELAAPEKQSLDIVQRPMF